jgi:hypothetical protein
MKQILLYTVSLFLVVAACSYEGFARSQGAATKAELAQLPIGRVTDESERYLLFEGTTVHRGFPVPDGNIWLYDKRVAQLTLLTPETTFGAAFFASDARLLSDQQGVVINVNYTDDAYNLYHIDLSSGEASWLTSAAALALAEIDTRSLTVRGDAMVFSASRLAVADRPELGLQMVSVRLELTNNVLSRVEMLRDGVSLSNR